jgi:hypothetical protein
MVRHFRAVILSQIALNAGFPPELGRGGKIPQPANTESSADLRSESSGAAKSFIQQ